MFVGPVLLAEDSMLWAANVWQMLREERPPQAAAAGVAAASSETSLRFQRK